MTLGKPHSVLEFGKSPKEPMVEQLCSLEVVESVIEEKVEGNDVLVGPVFDEKSFDDDEKMKKGVCAEKEKEIVVMNDDD